MGKRLICASGDVTERGKGVRFTIGAEKAFVIRYRGTAYGYVNRCAHVSIELDWAEGQFFDFTGTQLICATHGALYQPHTGKCVGGPCQGRRLVGLAIEEIGDNLYLVEALNNNDSVGNKHD